MDINEKLSQFIDRIATVKDSIQTEEATKTSMIMPFFQLLGYDVFNPLEFVPEYTADIGIKKGEKIDYAIIIDNDSFQHAGGILLSDRNDLHFMK